MPDRRPGVPKKQNPVEEFFSQAAIKTSPFGANLSAKRAYERSERLVAAIYLLTNHVPGDPTALAARAEALQLIGNALALHGQMRSPEAPAVRSIRGSIRHLVSLLRVLAVSGSVSVQNSSIVIEALDELGTFITSAQYSDFSESIIFSREDLDVRGPLIGQQKNVQNTIKDVKDAGTVRDINIVKDVKESSVVSPISDSNRQKDILSALQGGSEMGIRDIWSLLPQYSEKMIQRELAQLVASGAVKKVGLKRWSRYSVIR